MIAPGEIVALTIEKPAAGGRMIARADGLVVLVSGGIPGERVRAVVERVAKGVAYAAVVEIDEASPDRRGGAADPLCGGCLYAHIAYARQLEIKALVIADAFARIGRMPLAGAVHVAPSPEDGYRMRARLHVRGRLAGFFREGTHEVCEPRQTRQLLPETVDVLDRLLATAESRGIDAIREIELSENADASDRVVHLEAAVPLDGLALDALAETDGLTGLAAAGGTRGRIHVTDRISVGGEPPVSLVRHVLSFFQGNRYLLERFAAHVVDQLPAGREVIDLYAGVGLFAVAAACRGARVTAVEGDRVAAADLAVNAAAAPGAIVPVHESVEVFVRSAARAGRRAARVEGRSARSAGGIAPGESSRPTLIVDPPRTGMSTEALDGVLVLRAPRVVYVSCDVATLARDARRLVGAGYGLGRIDAFDLFPNTPHVETVSVFDLA